MTRQSLHRGLYAPLSLPGDVTVAFMKAWVALGGAQFGECSSTPLDLHSPASLSPTPRSWLGCDQVPTSSPVSAAASTVAFCSQCQAGGSTHQQPPHVPTRWRAWPVALEALPGRGDAFARLSSGTEGHQVPSAWVSGCMTATSHMWLSGSPDAASVTQELLI